MVARPKRYLFVRLWTAVIIAALVLSLIPTTPVNAIAQGDGQTIYSESAATAPRERDWTNSTDTFSSENTLASTDTAIRQVIMKACPRRNEVIAAVMTTGTLYILRWDGSSWNSEWNVASLGATTNLPRYDVVYQQSSGRAMVFYSMNTAPTDEISYRIYDGVSWTSETPYNASRTADNVHLIRAEPRPSTDEVVMMWADRSFDLSANYYDGSTDTWSGEPGSALSTDISKVGANTSPTTFSADVIVEQSSGQVLIVWGTEASGDISYVTRTAGSGGSWASPSTETAFAIEGTDISLRAEPGSDYAVYAGTTDNAGVGAEAAIWNGSSWVAISNFDTSTDSVFSATHNIASGWVKSGSESRAIVLYDDNNATGLDWISLDKDGTTWNAETDFTTSPAPSNVNDAMINMFMNPFDNSQLMALVVDSNSDLFAKKLSFNGSTLTWASVEPSGVVLETTVQNLQGWVGAFVYFQTMPVLTADIVDANGTTVSSPSVTMGTLASSGDCQTATGTFGASSQKMRVTNTTATATWTLSVAATGGATANWSTGSVTYDFNDGGGSPAGCGDGGDADSLAGQLTINPSVGTITPQTTCNTTGLTLGSSSAFAQGTTDSITLLSASGSARKGCYWDLTGASLSQKIPALQAAGSYSLSMTLTIVAS